MRNWVLHEPALHFRHLSSLLEGWL